MNIATYPTTAAKERISSADPSAHPYGTKMLVATESAKNRQSLSFKAMATNAAIVRIGATKISVATNTRAPNAEARLSNPVSLIRSSPSKRSTIT